MEPQVRTAVLTNYDQVARSVGLDPVAMLRRAGIRADALKDPEQLMPLAKGAQLLEDSARLSGCTSFGLLLAETRTLESIGAISLLLKYQPTVGEAVRSMVHYHRLMADALVMRLEEHDEDAAIVIDLAASERAVQGMELAIGVQCRTLMALSGERWQPSAVHFVHARPDDTRVHQRVFRCPLIFGADFYGMSCSAKSLATPNPGADPLMAMHARRYLDILMAQRDDRSVTERIARALHELLPAGRGTLDQVAASLQMSARTVQRELEQEGTSFSAVLNGVRSDRALRYLADAKHSVTDVALLTGYASLSSFTRWFTQEFGVPPAVWRAGGRTDDPTVRA